MSKAFTTKAVMELEPGISGLALDSTGQKHETADAWAAKLGDLAFLPYRRGRAVYKMAISGASAGGAISIEVRAGTVVLDTMQFTTNVSGAVSVTGETDLDLSSVAGETPITMRVVVDEVADAGVTGDFWGKIEVSTPLIVSTC